MQKYNPDIHHRRSVRLRNYDYAQKGLYFITICCWEKLHFFGEIDNGVMHLNDVGYIAQNEWLNTATIRKNVILHEFVIMPNHFHAILEITENLGVVENCNSPNNECQKFNGTSNTIGAIVRGFKISVIKNIKLLNEKLANQNRWQKGELQFYPTKIWQRNYHEHIIRNEQSYLLISEYIENNPLRWQDDCFYS